MRRKNKRGRSGENGVGAFVIILMAQKHIN